jgi:hypothetical protein
MVGAIKRGLTLRDFEDLTFGMVMGYIATYNDICFSDEEGKEDKDSFRMASQADFDNF